MQIIQELYQSKELNDCIKKMVREDLREDFKQELFLLLCEMDIAFLQELKRLGKIKYYVVRVIINLAFQKRNVFHEKYLVNKIGSRIEVEDIKDETNHEEVKEKEIKHEKIITQIAGMDNYFGTFYYRALTDLIKKYGTMREAARQTGIPVSTISRGIKKVKEHLKSKNV